MKVDSRVTRWIVIVLIGSIFCNNVMADPLDESIKNLESISKATESHYKDFVSDDYSLRIQTYFLQRMLDYESLFATLLELQGSALTRAEAIKREWDSAVANINMLSVSDSMIQLYIHKLDLENEKSTLKRIKSDLKTLKRFWKIRCSDDQVQWVMDRNNASRLYFVENVGVSPAPETGIGVKVGVGTHGSGWSLEDDSPSFKPGYVSKMGFVATAAAFQFASPAAPYVAAAVSACVIVSAVLDGVDVSKKINRQWDLVAEIRSNQIKGIKETEDNASQTISNACKKYFIAEFETQLDHAIQISQSYQTQVESYEFGFNSDWNAIKVQYSSFIDDLEQKYFPNLSVQVLDVIHQNYLSAQVNNKNSMIYMRDEMLPIVKNVGTSRGEKLDAQHRLWDKVIVGDALYSSSVNGVWNTQSRKLFEKISSK